MFGGLIIVSCLKIQYEGMFLYVESFLWYLFFWSFISSFIVRDFHYFRPRIVRPQSHIVDFQVSNELYAHLLDLGFDDFTARLALIRTANSGVEEVSLIVTCSQFIVLCQSMLPSLSASHNTAADAATYGSVAKWNVRWYVRSRNCQIRACQK